MKSMYEFFKNKPNINNKPSFLAGTSFGAGYVAASAGGAARAFRRSREKTEDTPSLTRKVSDIVS